MKARGLLLAGLLAITPLHAYATEPFWLKDWTVSGIDHAKTHPDLQRFIGTHIRMSAHSFRDETYEDCTGTVDYSDIQLRSTADLAQHFGTNWHWPKFPQANAVYGWVRCDGANSGGFAFVDSLHAYRFYEEGAVLQLQ